MKVTQQHIADRLGITRTTVARALNGSGPVKEELKELIIKTAAQMGYKVNYQAKTLSMQKETVICVFLASFYSKEFLKEVCDGVAKAQSELSGSKLRVNVHISREVLLNRQKQEVESILETENPDGIIMIPLSDEIIHSISNRCHQKDVRFVTLDMDTKSIPTFFHIGPDYYAGGKLAGGLMKRMINRQGTILLLEPERKFETLKLRSQGFQDVIMNHSNNTLKIIPIDIEKEVIYNTTLRELRATPSIVGIYSTIKIDGIPEALMKTGKEKDIRVIANDLSPYIATNIENDVIDAAIYFRPFEQGYRAVKELFKKIIMNIVEFENIETSFDVVIQENLEKFRR